MANTVSAQKRMRVTERRTQINRMRRTRLRHQIRTLRRLMDSKDVTAAQAAIPETFSIIDRSARVGVIKKNSAARFKSRLTKRLRALEAA